MSEDKRLSKAKSLIQKHKLNELEPERVLTILERHKCDVTLSDIEVILDELQVKIGDSFAFTDVSQWSFEDILGNAQSLSMQVLHRHLETLLQRQEAYARGEVPYPYDLVATLTALSNVADKLNGIRETVSINAAMKALTAQGYMIFKSSNEVIENRTRTIQPEEDTGN